MSLMVRVKTLGWGADSQLMRDVAGCKWEGRGTYSRTGVRVDEATPEAIPRRRGLARPVEVGLRD